MYDGFVSYSHAADGRLAPRLQSGLQRFAKPWWQRRALRIFRDESSLSANPHLWSSITDALDQSEWFVALLSPDAASSDWVNQEIAYWVTHKDSERIIPVVTGGEFAWDGTDATGISVPDALRQVFSDEPRWVDMRWARDEDQLELRDPRFADAVADIASAMRGIPKDDLAGEEVRQHRRTVRTARAVGALLAILTVVAVWAGVLSARNADAANRLAAAEAEARAEAEEEAARADATAQRLMEFVVRPQDPQQGSSAIVVPRNPVATQLPPTVLPTSPGPPTTERLDFEQEPCFGESCFRVPVFVRADPPSRTAYGLSVGTRWLAGKPFHIRHGFAGLQGIEDRMSTGYSVRLFLTRIAGPEDGTYKNDVPYRLEAGSMVDVTDPSCGPTLLADTNADVSMCTEWVFDFPNGLGAGTYQLALEWTAPCAAWFETDICTSPSRPISVHYVGGLASFLSEDWRRAFSTTGFAPEVNWPYDPWSDSEPLP